jgi:predicted dienelactone hydrolase
VLPAPTGRHALGTSIHHLVDPARSDLRSGRRGRALTVQLWYPAAAGGARPAAAYMPDPRIVDSMRARGYNRIEPARLAPLRAVRTHAGAGDAPRAGRRPVLVLSHGHGMSRSHYTALAEELASRGFLVAAIDHPYGGFMLQPDGRAVTLADDPADTGSDSVLARRAVEWAEDATFVLDELARGRRGGFGAAIGRVADVRRAGMLGHSFGGAAALEACRLDGRFRACATLDGRPFGPVRDEGVARPVLVMLSDPAYTDEELAARGRTRAQWEAMGRARLAGLDSVLARKTPTAHLVEVRGTGHHSFSDAPFTLPDLVTRWGGRLLPPARGHEIIGAWVRSFFAEHLQSRRGTGAEPWWRSLEARYPEAGAVHRRHG